MDYLKIDQGIQMKLEPMILKEFPGRYYNFSLNHYHENRYILLNTVLDDSQVHYEYIKGYVELHLEGVFGTYEMNDVWRQLVEESYKHESLTWHRWSNRNQGRCRLNWKVDSVNDIVKGFRHLASIFDPVLEGFFSLEKDNKSTGTEIRPKKIIPAVKDMKVNELKHKIYCIKDIPFQDLIIPEYQRPYKWGVKNVNQLINDIITFKKCKEYRLGTLVINDNDIVDGQQRIVTLSILLYVIFKKDEIAKQNLYQEVRNNIEIFWERTKFKNPYSLAHVQENLQAIKERIDDLDETFLDFLLNNCQFVVVQLPEIAEAFQFFDSQNARGKDLEPHDLLKAFHLREITDFSENDSNNIERWQSVNTDHLVDLFLTLYRVKRWSKSNNGKEFTKKDVNVFKGISLNSDRYPFYMQQIVCHYFSTIYADDISRNIDRSSLEFPFQLDQVCINGSRFFDMIRHYDELYKRICSSRTYAQYDADNDDKSAYKIIKVLNTYKNRSRVGDIYVRQLFDCLMMYYVDRFGFSEINKVTRKIFKYVYRLRLEHFSVQLSTIDNKAADGRMFRVIRDAQTPYDVINFNVSSLQETEMSRNADSDIKILYL